MTRLVLDSKRRNTQGLHYLLVLVMGGLGLLLWRLWMVQVVNGRQYEARQDQQAYRTIRLPAIRGRIFDRQGLPLVENRLSFELNLYLEELRPYFQRHFSNRRRRLEEQTGRRLRAAERSALGKQTRYEVVSNFAFRVSQRLPEAVEVEPSRFYRHYNEKTWIPFTLVSELDSQSAARFVESEDRIPGLVMEAQVLRTNHFDSLASHLLGYLRRNDQPDEESEYSYNYYARDYEGDRVGIEGYFDKALRGKAGLKALRINHLNYRDSEEVWVVPEAGSDVHLTIDAGLQRATEQALRSRSQSIEGAAVVLDVTNGDILAMASWPDYNPNEFIPSISSERYSELALNKERRHMWNLATQEARPPGSIFKIIVGLAGLQSGIIDPEVEIHCPGPYQIGRTSIKDTAPPGDYDFIRAFKKSSNYYFVEHGLKIEKERIIRLAKEFGLGKRETGLPLNAENQGYLPEENAKFRNMGGRWTAGDTGNLSIGQGDIDATPIQIASMVAAIANGGTVYAPRLVLKTAPASGLGTEGVKAYPPKIYNRVSIAPKNLRIIHEAMRADVADHSADFGTGRRAHVEGMEICGKTGTAEIDGNPRLKKVVWFASFAPLSAPRYAVVVMVLNGSSGGDTCAPIARRIYQAIQRRNPGERSVG